MSFTTYCYLFRAQLLTRSLHILAVIFLTSCGIIDSKNHNNDLKNAEKPLNSEKVSIRKTIQKTEINHQIARTDGELSADKLILEIQHEEKNTDLWQEIREGFSFSNTHPASSFFKAKKSYKTPAQRVELYRKRLLASPTLIHTVAINAEPYLYFVVSELKAANIPLEIALLPIVESRYDPFAYSPGRASGLWQFIPATGRSFGLHQDWWQDRRRDTVLATRSAIKYLSALHKRFNNDWLLAMAAYNAGQGNVAKAIRKNKTLGRPTDYWSLDLPTETEHYIPKLLAWRDIINKADEYAINLKPIANEPYFTLVDIGSQIDLAEVAALAEVDIDTIYKLNGSYNRWATDPTAPHLIAVPVANATLLQEKLANIEPDQRMSWQRYTIEPNDSLIKIGKKFNTSPKLIASINNIKNNRIRAGKFLLIPSASQSSDFYRLSADQRLSRRQNNSPKNKTQQTVHKVSNGESLWDISKKYKVGVNELARWNSMAPGDVLALNKNLVIWTRNKGLKKAPNEKRRVFYTVRKGDSLAHIANRFKVSVGDIKNWNNDANSKYIQPGQSLKLLVDITNRRSFN